MTAAARAIEPELNGKGEPANRPYGKFVCRTCGAPVFAPAFATVPAHLIELTCSKGHTDTYDSAKIEWALPSKPAHRLQHRQAAASLG